MNWNKNKSILLSQLCVIVFALLLLALDLSGIWWTRWFVTIRAMGSLKRVYLLISLCCIAAAVICLGSSLYYLAFLVLALSSAFMALIVRIVRDAFRQAIRMQGELDLTI